MLMLNTETRTSVLDELDTGRQCQGLSGGSVVAFDNNMFTHDSYLRAQRYERILVADGENGKQALFVDAGKSFLHLGRLNKLSNADIQFLCDDIFHNSDAGFIIFEDIYLSDDGSPFSYPSQSLSYQANWRLPILPGGKYVSSKRTRNLRWCRKKLAEQLDGKDLEFRFGKCRPGEVAAVAALNRDKIVQSGGRHYLTEAKLDVLNQVCSEIGYSSCLYADAELIAGNILCVAGKRAFGTLTGYNMNFQKFSPGLQVTLAAVSELEQLGCEEVNFLWGDNSWKSAFNSSREQLATLIVRKNQRALLSSYYWKQSGPYMKHAVKAAIKPHVKRLFKMK